MSPGERPDPWSDGTTAIYHITHVDNLASLAADGCLYCDTTCVDLDRGPVSIAYTDLKIRRASFPVAVAAGGTLADYVPFYYAPRSPMLYVIYRGGVAGYDGGQAEVVHLIFRLEEIAEASRFVITDGHAATPMSMQYDELGGLNMIDWEIMQETYWSDTDEDGDRKRRRQAEFLVHGHVPLNALRAVVTMTDEVAERARDALSTLENPPRVYVYPRWYY
jgi:hypothetical protein